MSLSTAAARHREHLVSLTPTTAGVVAAILVFSVAFGGLATFWQFGSHPEDLPGLYDYPSAVLGDGVLLPFAAAMLTTFICLTPSVPGDRSKAATALLVGAGLGALTQVILVLDASPTLNWTLPEPHSPSPAGYYHSALIVVLGGTFTSLVFTAAVRSQRLLRDDPDLARRYFTGVPFTLTATALFAFALLVFADSGTKGGLSHTEIAITTCLAAGVLAIGLIVGWRRWSRIRPAGWHMVLAIGTATVITIAAEDAGTPSYLRLSAVATAVGGGLTLWGFTRFYGGSSNVITHVAIAAGLFGTFVVFGSFAPFNTPPYEVIALAWFIGLVAGPRSSVHPL